jgi:iron complex outermembrane receptor protein
MVVFYSKSSIFAFLLLLTIDTYAQIGGTIKGHVKSMDGQPAPFVNLILKELGKGTVSDEQGFFVLKNVAAGNYTLIVSLVGHAPKILPITILADETIQVTISLSENAHELAEVIITDKRTINEIPLQVGKAGIKPMDLPQSVVSISKDVMVQQQALRLSDVLKNVSGLYVMGNTGGTQEELAGRGFAYNSSNTFKNGTRFNNGVMPEMSSLERVEIMKGSNAILFGNVAAGGIINLVTRKPKFENGGEVSFRAGSYGFYKPSIDVYGSLADSNRIAYRVNATYENTKSFRDDVYSERVYINPSFLIKAGKKTELLLEGDFLKDNRTNDYGLAAINYQIVDLPRERFIGARWSYFHAVQKSETLTITHQLNSSWRLKAIGAYQSYQTDLFGTTRPNSNNRFVSADGKWIRDLQRSEVDETYTMAQTDLIGHFKTGNVEHEVLIGADVDQYHTATTAYNNLLKYDSINVFDLNLYAQRSDIPMLSKRTLTKNPTTRYGAYVQDLITMTAKLKLLAGVRYSYMNRNADVFTYSNNTWTATPYSDDAFSPRFGLIYQPSKTTSLFASYSNSFTLNTGIDVNSQPLPASFINQYEMGIKNDLFNGLLSANAIAYQIVNSNLAQSVIIPNGNPANLPANAQELAGEVTSKGFEFDVMSKSYRGFSVIAGYSYNETKYTKSNIYIEGSLLRYNPKHTSNFSVYYQFDNSSWLKNFNLGWTSFYTGNRVAGRSTRLTITNDSYQLIPLPGFIQQDCYIGYGYKKISLRVKGSNLFNALSYNVHDDNSVNPIAPRMFSTSLSVKL